MYCCTFHLSLVKSMWSLFYRTPVVVAISHDVLPPVRPIYNWECWVVLSVQHRTGLLRRTLEQGKTALDMGGKDENVWDWEICIESKSRHRSISSYLPVPRCEPGCLQTELGWRLLEAARDTIGFIYWTEGWWRGEMLDGKRFSGITLQHAQGVD